MLPLFNYTTLATSLDKTTRTLVIGLKKPDTQNAITQELLFELESMLAWCTSRVEIHSILIESTGPDFSHGFGAERLATTSSAQLEKLAMRLHKIIFAMLQMPQTIVIDLGNGARNWAMELALGADIRLCRRGADLRFDHGRLGLTPAAGGMSFLTHFVGASFARPWLLSGQRIAAEQLQASGLIHEVYDETSRQSNLQQLLADIHQQAPIQRIQTKLGLFESQRHQIETALQQDLKIAKAARVSEDWRHERKDDKQEFMPAKSMSYSVKLSLVKSGPERGPELDH